VKTLYILIGASGSGKSTWILLLRNRMLAAGKPCKPRDFVVCSADSWFYRNDAREYQFNVQELRAAHSSSMGRARLAMRRGAQNVVIDNTNLTLAEISRYMDLGHEFGYTVEFHMSSEQDPEVLSGRNKHGVPLSGIQVQLARLATLIADWPSDWPAYQLFGTDRNGEPRS
jgi:predicted kinase